MKIPLYLDHAATTPCREEVWEAMQPYALKIYGNPNSIHGFGREARQAVESARMSIAAHLRCKHEEIVFTSGGSKSDNLALRGLAHAYSRVGKHIVTSAIEHEAVLATCADIEAEGFEVTRVPVNSFGQVNPDEVAAMVRPDTVLVSIMHANNEIGTVQPLAEISHAVKARNATTLVHTDAVQTVGHLAVDVDALGVDLLTFAAHKFYGPKGVGGLYVRSGLLLQPQIAGGGQQHGVRCGTESVPLIVGMAKALEMACDEMLSEQERWTNVRDALIAGLLANIDDCRLNGHPCHRLPNNVNVSFRDVVGEDLILLLNMDGILTSAASACASQTLVPSHVLCAIGLKREWALGSLRLTFGHACDTLSVKDVTELVSVIKQRVQEQRYTR